MANSSKTFKLTAEELGGELFGFAAAITRDTLEGDNAKLGDFDIARLDPNLHYREMYIITLFSVAIAFRGLLDNDNLDNNILGAMFDSYYHSLVTELSFSEKQIETEQIHIRNRFDEYYSVMRNNTEDYLMPLAKRMLNNMTGKESINFFNIMNMTIEIASILKTIPDLISKYEIITT